MSNMGSIDFLSVEKVSDGFKRDLNILEQCEIGEEYIVIDVDKDIAESEDDILIELIAHSHPQ